MLKTFVNPQVHTFSLFSYWLKVPHTEKNTPERGKEGDGEMERGGGVGPNETTLCCSLRLHSGQQQQHFMVGEVGITHLVLNICGFAISGLAHLRNSWICDGGMSQYFAN
jgi:hypothetical protein